MAKQREESLVRRISEMSSLTAGGKRENLTVKGQDFPNVFEYDMMNTNTKLTTYVDNFK